MAIKIEDIIFWLAILAAIGIMIWKLFGSPTDLATLVSIVSLLFVSELTLWKAIFSVEKKTIISFIKMKNEINNGFIQINNKLNNMENLMHLIKNPNRSKLRGIL